MMSASNSNSALQNMSISLLRNAYTSGALSPVDVVEHIINTIDEDSQRRDWAYLLPRAELLANAESLEMKKDKDKLPLFGIPFSVKDNIHIANTPIGAGNKYYNQLSSHTADVVRLLLDAGAMLIGKNTMDEFATGVVGVRSEPHPVNPINNEYVSGGSSSGSAVVVSKCQVCFSLGSDTGGSGRVPAALCNIAGYKPTPKLFGNHGMIYANKSIDCIPIFAKSITEIDEIFDVLFHKLYSAKASCGLTKKALAVTDARKLRIAIPNKQTLKFFGDQAAEECFCSIVSQLEYQGFTVDEIDISPFVSAGELLFDGAMLNERYMSINEYVRKDWFHVNDTVREIVTTAHNVSTEDLWAELYEVKKLRQEVSFIYDGYDLLITPTTGAIYKISDVYKNPIELNNNLAYYTNFGNILDLSIVTVPMPLRRDGLPFGISLIGDSFSDKTVMNYGKMLESIYMVEPGIFPISKTDYINPKSRYL